MKTPRLHPLLSALLVSMLLAGGCTGGDHPAPQVLPITHAEAQPQDSTALPRSRPALPADAPRVDQTVNDIAAAHDRLIRDVEAISSELDSLRQRLEARRDALIPQ